METNKSEQPEGLPDFEPLFKQLKVSMDSIKPSLEKIQAEVDNSKPVSSRKVIINDIECIATLHKNGHILLEPKFGKDLFDSFTLG